MNTQPQYREMEDPRAAHAWLYARQYGGVSADWVKKTSTSWEFNQVTYSTHWVENVRTGMRVDPKTKIGG
ncbi:hypothetical protein [Cryobacterium zongtaii]|uniref:hypothetical protein n=1 Tax=Cryobacterium zongtaii TaxID=1259217 RepID=UPI001AD7EA4D|nr:hypothetical protein [Cryobacterium zongtaii]